MRDPAELPADLLEGRLAASLEPEDSASATRIARVAQLADRGDHQAAAREAAELLEAQIYDVRLIGFYLFGLFLQRGIGYLPALLDRVSTLVAGDLAALRPSRRKLQVVSSATAWLFENVSTRLLFHTKQRDVTWESWRAASDSALADAIVAGCTKATLALEALIDAPLAAVPLARLRRWTNDDLRRALVRREATVASAPAVASAAEAVVRDPDREPGISSADPGAGTITGQREAAAEVPTRATGSTASKPVTARVAEELPAEPLHPDEWVGEQPAEPAAEPAGLSDDGGALPDEPAGGVPGKRAVAVGSPALAALQAKLRGFQALIARGELAKAAVVASDVRAVLANFDPVAYFPSMFAAYFKALHQVIDALAPYLDGVDQPSWHALDSYYRADMRGFFDD